jgi:hypothetical protein
VCRVTFYSSPKLNFIMVASVFLILAALPAGTQGTWRESYEREELQRECLSSVQNRLTEDHPAHDRCSGLALDQMYVIACPRRLLGGIFGSLFELGLSEYNPGTTFDIPYSCRSWDDSIQEVGIPNGIFNDELHLTSWDLFLLDDALDGPIDGSGQRGERICCPGTTFVPFGTDLVRPFRDESEAYDECCVSAEYLYGVRMDARLAAHIFLVSVALILSICCSCCCCQCCPVNKKIRSFTVQDAQDGRSVSRHQVSAV